MTVKISRLDNGIHVITDDYPHLQTTALGLWVRAGARDETAGQNGIAHLLEHMAFKGTKRRNARSIAEEIEAAGGDINASTSMENTGYFARVLKDDWLMALDVIADIVTEPVFDPDELAREKDVILQEIAAANDTPDDLVFDLMQNAAFPQHSLGRPILGPADQVAAYQVSDLEAYRASHYQGARMVLSAAGRIDHDAFVEQAAQRFANVAQGEGVNWNAASFTGGIQTAERPLDQSHVAFGFPALGYRDRDIYVVQVLANLLGGGMSSRLFQEVREKRGLCYSVFSFVTAYQDTGMVAVYAGTAPDKLNELTDVTSTVMQETADTINEAEIARAKAQLKASLVMSLESAAARADQVARQFLAFGKVPDITNIAERIDAVSQQDVARLSRQIFTTSNLSLGAVGNLSNLSNWGQLVARFV